MEIKVGSLRRSIKWERSKTPLVKLIRELKERSIDGNNRNDRGDILVDPLDINKIIVECSHLPHNDYLVNDRLHIRWWSYKIIMELNNSYCLVMS